MYIILYKIRMKYSGVVFIFGDKNVPCIDDDDDEIKRRPRLRGLDEEVKKELCCGVNK